jgi:hypothetical protein
MITACYIIRHGLTINAEQKRYIGHLDVPLSQVNKSVFCNKVPVLKRMNYVVNISQT